MSGGAGVSTLAAPRADEGVLRAAVDWRVRFESGGMTPDERSAFERWRAADARHAQAWQQVEQLLHQPLSVVQELGQRAPGQAQAAHRALVSKRRRQFFRGALAVAATAGGSALLVDRMRPVGQLLADYSTATGERRRVVLADGVEALLNARSAMDVSLQAGLPQLQLLAGELIVSVTAGARHGVEVLAGAGRLRADAGRFLVSRQHAAMQAVALSGTAQVFAGDGPGVRLAEGQGVLVSAEGIRHLPGQAASRASWQNGMLSVNDAPLEDVVQALQAYYRGIIRVAPALRQQRVFGVFPLDDPEQALQVLAQSMQLEIKRLGWLVTLDPIVSKV